MVRRKNTLSPVYPAAAGAGTAFYAGCSANLPAILIVGTFFFTVFLLCTAIPCSRFLLPRAPAKKRLFFICCFLAGISAGLLCALRVHAEVQPPVTLATSSQVSEVTCTLLSDPSPYGQFSYRVPCQLRNCRCADSSAFSASGICTLVLPAAMVRESMPGGLFRRGSEKIIFSSGLILAAQGHFAPEAAGQSPLFVVNSNTSAKECKNTVLAVGWKSPADKFRSGLRLALIRILFDWKEAGGFLLALLAGNRDYLEPSLATDFRLSGLSHVLALSGIHLSLLGLVAIKTGKLIGGKRVSLRLSLFAMFFFVWFAGGSPSLNRALIFAVLMIIVRGLGFEARVLPLLAATCIIQMLWNPAETLSLAFILSCSALWGILTFGESLSSMAEKYIPRRLFSDIAASTGAQLMTAPVIACAIGVLAPSGIIASCLISPLSSVYLVAGIILLAVASLVPPLAYSCGILLDLMYRCIAIPAHFFARFPVLEVRDLSVMIPASIIPLVAGFFIMYLSCGAKKRRSPDAGFARL